MARTQVVPTTTTQSMGLPEVLERVLDKGIVIAGDIKIKLCDIELLSIQIRLLIASVDKARELGVTWWWQEQAAPTLPAPHAALQVSAGPAAAWQPAPSEPVKEPSVVL
jgi:hypothetical protein